MVNNFSFFPSSIYCEEIQIWKLRSYFFYEDGEQIRLSNKITHRQRHCFQRMRFQSAKGTSKPVTIPIGTHEVRGSNPQSLLLLLRMKQVEFLSTLAPTQASILTCYSLHTCGPLRKNIQKHRSELQKWRRTDEQLQARSDGHYWGYLYRSQESKRGLQT